MVGKPLTSWHVATKAGTDRRGIGLGDDEHPGRMDGRHVRLFLFFATRPYLVFLISYND
jgi:hypothetical protein